MKDDYPRLEVPTDLRRKMVEVARRFRKELTPSEKILWQTLRGKKLDGLKFRRQQPIGPLIVDFFNSDYGLVIEVDGPIHNRQKEADLARQEILEFLGLNILRVKAEMVETNLPGVLALIRSKLHEIQERSLSRMGEGQGGGHSPSPLVGEGQGGDHSPSPLVGEGQGGDHSPSPLVGEGRGGG